jgi:quercetin dioxygenase-like cupin family protein
MHVRRIVTGRTPEGKSVFVEDTSMPPVTLTLLPGAEFHQVWGSDQSSALPSDGSQPPWSGYFPPPEGYRFAYFTLGPESVTIPDDLDVRSALEELQAKLPGMVEVMEPAHPGMHTTDTVDFVVVLSGSVWLELDEDEERLVGPGDCVIQNGTRHAWHNRSDRPCTLAVALLGARARPRGPTGL